MTDCTHTPEQDVPEILDLGLREELVQLRDPQSGQVSTYVLVELDGTQRDAYLNAVAARMRTNAQGQPAGVKNFTGLQADLLSRSLFSQASDGSRKPVDAATIQKWPARVQAALHKKAKALSALDDEADAKAGND